VACQRGPRHAFNVRVRINDVVCSCARALSFRGQRVHVCPPLTRDGPRGFFGDSCPGNPKLYKYPRVPHGLAHMPYPGTRHEGGKTSEVKKSLHEPQTTYM